MIKPNVMMLMHNDCMFSCGTDTFKFVGKWYMMIFGAIQYLCFYLKRNQEKCEYITRSFVVSNEN